jgi:hypothetical protein
VRDNEDIGRLSPATTLLLVALGLDALNAALLSREVKGSDLGNHAVDAIRHLLGGFAGVLIIGGAAG